MTSNDVRVFISYRRRDCQAQANGLHDGLMHRLPGASIFKDLDSIPFGADFEEHIRAEIGRCDVVLVLIGDQWLDIRDAAGARRLDDAADFVRLEIETAMSTPSVRVIPVLVENATMPRQADLPPSIQRLARLRAIELSDGQWRRDLTVLTSTLEHLATERVSSPKASASEADPRSGAPTIGLDALDAAAIAHAIGALPHRFQTKDVSEARSVLTAHRSASAARNYHTMVGRHLLKHQKGLSIRSAGKSDNGRGEWWQRLGESSTASAEPDARQRPHEVDSATAEPQKRSGDRHRPPVEDDLLDVLVALTELDRDWVQSVVQDLRFVIDCLVADDWTVLLPPVVLRRAGDPVATALLSRLLDHPSPELVSSSMEELEAILDLPETLIDTFPVASLGEVIVEMASLHDIDALDESVVATELEEWWAPYGSVIDAWLAAWEEFAPNSMEYHVSVLDRGADVGAWLCQHLHDLEPSGLPVRLHARQHRFRDGYTADLICRATKDGENLSRGDWLIVKAQSDMADLGVLEQLRGQLDACRLELAAPGEAVKGLLVSDGVTVELQSALEAAGCSRLSLTALGLRHEWANRLRTNVSPVEADRVRRASLRIDVLPEKVMDALYVEPSVPSHWVVEGVTYGKRSEANKALAAFLGTYTAEEWAEAQRRHGLR